MGRVEDDRSGVYSANESGSQFGSSWMTTPEKTCLPRQCQEARHEQRSPGGTPPRTTTRPIHGHIVARQLTLDPRSSTLKPTAMKNNFTLIQCTIVLLYANDLAAQAPTWQWAESAGGTFGEQVEAMVVDAGGNTIVTGHFESATVNFDLITLTNGTAGIGDVFVAKYDPAGNVLWAMSAGGAGEDAGLGLALDGTGNIFLCGYFKSAALILGSTTLTNAGSSTSDAFMAKMDPSGNVLWALRIGGVANEEAAGIATDAAGNATITGFFASPSITIGLTPLTNAGSEDVLTAKFDPDGNAIWASASGGSASDRGRGVAADAAGNSYIIGNFSSSMLSLDAFVFTNTNTGSADVFLARYDASGVVSWARQAVGSTIDDGRTIAVDASGSVIAAGTFTSATLTIDTEALTNTTVGEEDIFLVKFAPDGDALWATSAGGSIDDRARKVVVDATGAIFLAGYFQSAAITFGSTTLTTIGDDDLYVAKYDGGGTAAWAISAGSIGSDRAHAVAVESSGLIHVGGYFDSEVMGLSGIFLINATPGEYDLFVGVLGGTAAVAEHQNGTLLMYPNPTEGTVTIGVPISHGRVSVFDARGKEVYASSISAPRPVIDLSACQGLYLVRVQDDRSVYMGRVLVQ